MHMCIYFTHVLRYIQVENHVIYYCAFHAEASAQIPKIHVIHTCEREYAIEFINLLIITPLMRHSVHLRLILYPRLSPSVFPQQNQSVLRFDYPMCGFNT